MRVAEAIASAAAAECPGTPVFSLIGDGNLHIAGAIDREPNLRQVMVRHEGAAVAMAEGYARTTGRLGLASVTSGPGLTHAATSIFAASGSRIPMVILTGAPPFERPVGLQELSVMDQRQLAESCHAAHARLQSARSLEEDLRSAFCLAHTRRRPVVLDVPVDLQHQEVAADWSYVPSAEFLPQQLKVPLEASAAKRIARQLREAERPLILAGRGAFGARELLEQLADRTRALLSTTLPAKGLFDGHEWNIGVVGGYSTEVGKELIRAADLIVAFGAELGHFTTQAGTLFQGRDLVRVENRPYDAPLSSGRAELLQADASAAAEGLLAVLAASTSRSVFRTEAVRELLDSVEDLGPAPSDGRVHPAEMMRVATRLIPADAAVVIGGGHFFSFPSIYLDRPANGSLLVPVGAAAIGQALPIGIGASQAQRDRPVVVLEGDGSILMHIQELETARRLHAHIMVVLMNDEALTAERLGLQFSGYNPEIVMYDSPDFVSIARGFGWQAMRVTELSELGTAFAMFAQTDGPALVDVRISQQVLINPTEIHDLSRAPA